MCIKHMYIYIYKSFFIYLFKYIYIYYIFHEKIYIFKYIYILYVLFWYVHTVHVNEHHFSGHDSCTQVVSTYYLLHSSGEFQDPKMEVRYRTT